MENAVDLLPANLQNTLHQIVDRTNASNGGIRAILLSTAEGVPLGRVYADRNSPLNEDVLSSIESTWAPASKQFPLLNMGKEARIVTAIYDHGKVDSSDRRVIPIDARSHTTFTFYRHNTSCIPSPSGRFIVCSVASFLCSSDLTPSLHFLGRL
jgi:hypothetical protein